MQAVFGGVETVISPLGDHQRNGPHRKPVRQNVFAKGRRLHRGGRVQGVIASYESIRQWCSLSRHIYPKTAPSLTQARG